MPLLLLIAAAIAVLLVRVGAANAPTSLPAPATPPDGAGGTSISDYEPIDAFTEAWAHFEGWDKSGSLAQRNNNPVNIKGSWDGTVGHTPSGFAIFSDPSYGWGAAESWVQDQAKQHPDWSIRQLLAKAMGSLTGQDVNNEQGNSVMEAENISGELGVPDSTNLAAYLGGQQ